MTVKLVGIENKKYKIFKQKLEEILFEEQLNVEIEEINDLQYIINHPEINTIPALEIDNKLMFQVNGTMPTKIELKHVIDNIVEDKIAIKSIGFLTDLSNNSGNALIYADKFAAQFGAKISVSNVLEPSFDESNPYYAELLLDMVSARENHLKWFLEFHLGEEAKNINQKVSVGNLKAEILSLINDSAHPLFIMNSNKHGFLHNLFFGSVSKYVKKYAKKDVLMIPGETEFKPFEKILFILLNLEKQKSQLKKFLDYAKLFGVVPYVISLDEKITYKEALIESAKTEEVEDLHIEGFYYFDEKEDAQFLPIFKEIDVVSSSRVDDKKRTITLLEKLFPIDRKDPKPFLYLS